VRRTGVPGPDPKGARLRAAAQRQHQRHAIQRCCARSWISAASTAICCDCRFDTHSRSRLPARYCSSAMRTASAADAAAFSCSGNRRPGRERRERPLRGFTTGQCWRTRTQRIGTRIYAETAEGLLTYRVRRCPFSGELGDRSGSVAPVRHHGELARAEMFDYIEVFYNRIRRHSHLGGVSPEAFEQASA
jgi:transposase InsO family protein